MKFFHRIRFFKVLASACRETGACVIEGEKRAEARIQNQEARICGSPEEWGIICAASESNPWQVRLCLSLCRGKADRDRSVSLQLQDGRKRHGASHR